MSFHKQNIWKCGLNHGTYSWKYMHHYLQLGWWGETLICIMWKHFVTCVTDSCINSCLVCWLKSKSRIIFSMCQDLVWGGSERDPWFLSEVITVWSRMHMHYSLKSVTFWQSANLRGHNINLTWEKQFLINTSYNFEINSKWIEGFYSTITKQRIFVLTAVLSSCGHFRNHMMPSHIHDCWVADLCI
jgi:hypothetical protein